LTNPSRAVADFAELQAALRHEFRDPTLLRLALTHPSVSQDQADPTRDNQRLEFLGDAVLELVLTQSLYEQFPQLDEGALTKARAHMVNRRTLADHGRRLGLGAYLILSRGEEATGGRARPAALADAFEALVGAIFLDGGFAAAREFVLWQFPDATGPVEQAPVLDNPKGELQEKLQAQSPEPVRYRVEAVTGPDHDREFECSVHWRGEELGRGRGRSKKDAESQAARAALERFAGIGPAPSA
jgi:ribonuclease-3